MRLQGPLLAVACFAALVTAESPVGPDPASNDAGSGLVSFSDYNNNWRGYAGAMRGQGGNPYRHYWGKKRQADPAAEAGNDAGRVSFSDYNNNWNDYVHAMRGQGGNPYRQYWGKKKRQADPAAEAGNDAGRVSFSDYNNNWNNYVKAM